MALWCVYLAFFCLLLVIFKWFSTFFKHIWTYFIHSARCYENKVKSCLLLDLPAQTVVRLVCLRAVLGKQTGEDHGWLSTETTCNTSADHICVGILGDYSWEAWQSRVSVAANPHTVHLSCLHPLRSAGQEAADGDKRWRLNWSNKLLTRKFPLRAVPLCESRFTMGVVVGAVRDLWTGNQVNAVHPPCRAKYEG